MPAPSDYAVTIYINDVDVTDYVPFESMAFEDYARQVSTLKFTVENPSGVTPARAHSVRMVRNDTSVTEFLGYIVELVSKKRDNGVTKIYEIDAADMKIRLQKSVVPFGDYIGSDADILADLLANAYPDLTDLFDFDIAALLDDLEFNVNDENLLDLLDRLADKTGAEYSFETGGEGVLEPELLGTIDFDGGYSNYTTDSDNITASEQTGGNPDNAFIGTTSSPVYEDSYIEVAFDLDTPIFVTDFAADILVTLPVGGAFGLAFYHDNHRIYNDFRFSSTAWDTIQWSVDLPGIDRTNVVVNSRFAVRLYVGDNTSPSGTYTFGIDNVKLWGTPEYGTITFDVGSEPYTVYNTGAASIGETSGGNPDNCYSFLLSDTTDVLEIEYDLGEEKEIAGVGTHYMRSTIVSTNPRVRLLDAGSVEVANEALNPGNPPITEWGYFGFNFDPPVMAQFIRIRQSAIDNSDLTIKFDNIAWRLASTVNKTALNWGEPEAADYDIDVASTDEYAFDIDLFEGDFDDFNSIIVTGGMEDVPIDWLYESDGTQDHFKLETPVKDIVVYTNSGTDVTPSWTELDDGKWGTDTLTGAGGTKDVLYDPQYYWLYFDTEPPYLTKSYRVTGTIQRPIRVLVEDVNGSDPVYATPLHDDSITSLEDAVARGEAELEKRNSIKRLEFKTYNPGLKPGKTMTVNDSARGLSETLTIQHISTTWLGSSGHALFNVTCGNEDTVGADSLIANNDKRSRDKASPVSMGTQTVNFVVDVDSTPVVDVDGQSVYEVT